MTTRYMPRNRIKSTSSSDQISQISKKSGKRYCSFLNTTSCIQTAVVFCKSCIVTCPMQLQTRPSWWWCFAISIQSIDSSQRTTSPNRKLNKLLMLTKKARKTSCVRMRTISRACQCWKAAIQSPSRRSTTPWTSQRSQRGRKRNFTRETSSTCWPRMSKTQKTRI